MPGFEESYGQVQATTRLDEFLRAQKPTIKLMPLLEKGAIGVDRGGTRIQPTTPDYELLPKDFVWITADGSYGPVDTAIQLDEYLKKYEPAWKVPTLIAKGAISVERGVSRAVVTKPSYTLQPKDWVFVDPNAPGVQAELAKVASAKAKDYLFAPGGTGYEVQMAKTLGKRPGTLPIPSTLQDLSAVMTGIRFFRDSPVFRQLAETPMRSLLVVGHASSRGNLEVPRRAQRPNHEEDGYVSYEGLIESIAEGGLTVPTEAITPRPKDGSGKDIPLALHIKGCLIGKHDVFLKKLKEALAPGVDLVTAPKFYNGASNFTGRGAPDGVFEYMVHDYTVLRPTRTGSRFALLKAFQTAGFTNLDGSSVDSRRWGEWLPPEKDLHSEKRLFTRSVAIELPLVSGPVRTDISVEYQYRTMTFQNWVAVPHKPVGKQDELDALVKGLPARNAKFSDQYPFPAAVRLGYKDLRSMLEGFELKTQYDASKHRLSFTAVRHEYTLRAPVVEGRRLFVNFTPNDPRLQPTIMLRETDPRFYGSA